MDSSDLSSVTASGIWMRIFRSVSLHYSVDPHNSQSALILVIYNARLQGRREHSGEMPRPCFAFFFIQSTCYFRPEHISYVCLLFLLCLPTSECKRHKVQNFFLLTNVCTPQEYSSAHRRYSVNICSMNKWVKM